MRRHKILGDYREQATASLCSEMCTCGAGADVSNLDADSRLIQNVYQKRRLQVEAIPACPRSVIPQGLGEGLAESPSHFVPKPLF